MPPKTCPIFGRFRAMCLSRFGKWESPARVSRFSVNDTGVNSHPNLPNPKAKRNFTGDRNDDDQNGHGTHCSGSVLGRDGVGCAPEADLIYAKVLSNQGSGSTQGINAGRVWASENGADIISESLGGGGSNRDDVDSINRAYENGTQLVVCAAGNSGYRGSNTIGYPGRYLETYCVGSYRKDGEISNFSSGGREIDVATPGRADYQLFASRRVRGHVRNEYGNTALCGINGTDHSEASNGWYSRYHRFGRMASIF